MSNKPSYETAGASTPMMALKIFGYSVLAGIMCMFVSFSMTMLSSGLFMTTVGFHEYEIVNGEKVLLETVIFDENTTYESEKETATDDREIVREMITEPKDGAYATLAAAFEVLEQVLLLVILIGLTGYYVYREGDLDRNLVKHHERRETPLRGLWIGSLAMAPSAIVYGLLVAGKLGFCADSIQSVYRLLNPVFTPIIVAVMPTSVYPATQITVSQLVILALLLLVLPLACAVAYQLGYRRVFRAKKQKKQA